MVPSGERHAAVRQQPGVGALHGRAGVGEDERPGAVGALGVALVEAGLSEERRLLVAGEAGDRQRQAEEGAGVGGRDLAPVGHQLGQRVARDSEERAQLVGPVARLEVEEQGAGGVGDVGDVPGAAGHPRDQVGVDGADGVAPGLDERPGVRLVLGQPDQLGAGEVGVEPQPGQLARPAPRDPRRAAGGRCRRCAGPATRSRAAASRGSRGPTAATVSRWLVIPIAAQLGGVVRRRAPGGWPRGSPARSPRARARPSPAGGSAGGTPGSPCAGDRPVGGDDDGGHAGGAGVDGEDAHWVSSPAAR